MIWSKINPGALIFYTKSDSMAPGERENPGARGDMTGEERARRDKRIA